jgi:hypothetical protein
MRLFLPEHWRLLDTFTRALGLTRHFPEVPEGASGDRSLFGSNGDRKEPASSSLHTVLAVPSSNLDTTTERIWAPAPGATYKTPRARGRGAGIPPLGVIRSGAGLPNHVIYALHELLAPS